MGGDLVSVVIVTYNHEKYIGKAIESVVTQVFDGTMEILIGDDGSSDKTVDILCEYEKKYKNIRLFIHENLGLSQNVYELFTNARGKYIAVLEGDDYWIDNGKIKKQIECIEKHNCIATACNSLIIEKEKIVGSWSRFDKDRELTISDIEKYQHQLFHPSAALFRNIFAGSGEQYNIIATAHRMGGNHTGLINLLGSKGKIYLQHESYTVWRKSIGEGLNYSAKREMTLEDIHDHLVKYIRYKEYYCKVYNFDEKIYMYYVACIKKLSMEVRRTSKNFWGGFAIYCLKRCFSKLIGRK